jgi:uncharacterized protein YjbJ (UPF0337 family)
MQLVIKHEHEEELTMAANWDEVASKWQQMGGAAKRQWGKLTDDELLEINGDRELLAGKLEEKYGIARQYVDIQINKWVDKLQV